MIISLYKAKDHLFNRMVAWWKKGIYSHTEIIFSSGRSGSSSFRDDGVRVKKIEYSPEKWDFIILPQSFDENASIQWFSDHQGNGYDSFGIIGHVWQAIADRKDKYVCSEAVLTSLGYREAWRFDPNDMAPMLKITPIKGCDFDFEKYNVPRKQL
jgi:hypothetical protein